MRKATCTLMYVVIILGLLLPLTAAEVRFPYQKPPKVITDIVESAPLPVMVISPTRDRALVVDSLRHPPIADLAEPMLRLAGLRINPATNGPQLRSRRTGLALMTLADGKQQKLALPPNAVVSMPRWSPDGKRFAFTNTVANGIELWVGDTASGKLRKVRGVSVNSVMGSASRGDAGHDVQWMPDSRTLLVSTVPAGRGAPPMEPKAPYGPNVQESSGKSAPIPTYEDLLGSAHDEDLFDYYATAQLALVDALTFTVKPLGKPGIFDQVDSSPDGAHFLVASLEHPYSYLLPADGFPKNVEVWNRTGKVEYHLASLPMEDHVPMEGVPTGPRSYRWIPTASAKLIWAEALDEGDPKKPAPFRDRLMILAAPFSGNAAEYLKLEQRFTGITFGENGLAFVNDFDRNKRWVRTFLVNLDQPGQMKQVWSRSMRDRYNDPGSPLMRTLPNGQLVMAQHGISIFLSGRGASAKGDYPFLDRFNLETLKSDRIFQAAEETYEEVFALASDDGSTFVTRFETPTDPTNYFIRNAAGEKRQLTIFPDPAPTLRGITKQLVTYKRPDGVQLSFTLYLPADYKEGQRLPTIIWAYPLEYNDAATAGQVSGSQYRFTIPVGMSHLFLLTQGYAVLDNATMPVVGDPESMNNTYIEQITASAKAAIDKAVEMGVTDRNRVGVGGHSYGAFMTANLLAHTDLFKAGVARSGAYNRTLTPFGFQSERRTFWEAPAMYMNVSPFAAANKINTPILLIHGEADDNSGTFPIQSERMYQALKGNGATVRYVTLPYEAHGYIARESVEHTLWEMITWFDKWVKNAPAPVNTGHGSK